MTELLYQQDSYLKKFTANIIDIQDNALILDKTAFSPRGGGLDSDSGIIKITNNLSFKIQKVTSKKGQVLHHTLSPPSKDLIGKEAICRINWEPRYRQMRLHTTLHAISGMLYKKYGAVVTGGNITPEKARVDFEIDHLHKNRVNEITEHIQKIIDENHPIQVSYIPRSEALKDPNLIRTKVNLIPEFIKTIRIVEIVGVDKQADGGIHVSSTVEIGKFIPIKSESRGKNNKRLYFTVKP